VQFALGGLGLGYSSDEGGEKSEFHIFSLKIFIFNSKIG
jgi:hypothetical protein